MLRNQPPMQEKMRKTLNAVRRPSPHFQRSINPQYDLGNKEYIAAYIPTPNTCRALTGLLNATRPDASHRATLLYGPYGSGKSLFAVLLAEIFSRPPDVTETLAPVVARLQRFSPETADIVETYVQDGPRLLTIVLSGDEDDLATALLRALTRSLHQVGLGDIRPRTHYRAALETLQMWRRDFPAIYEQLDSLLARECQENSSPIGGVGDLQDALAVGDDRAFDLFLSFYPQLTAGATFNFYYRQSVVDAYKETVATLCAETDYDGVVVIWDEFGRFLESHISEPFGKDAALLQEFAEFANRSGTTQVHLILITHKIISGYAFGLPAEYEKEWARIAERFVAYDISSDPFVAYRLIAEALVCPDPALWQSYLSAHRELFEHMLRQTVEHNLFPALDYDQIWQWVVTGAYPLHPLAVYALPRLSNQIAQNERTLFTFLAADEPKTLSEYLITIPLDASPRWIGVDALYDYFSEAMKTSVGPGGLHTLWAMADYALRKISTDDELSRRLIKSLAILSAVSDGTVHPNTSTLAFAMGVDVETIETTLGYLLRRKVVLHNRSDDTWQLSIGSTVDIEAAVQSRLDRRPPTTAQLRRFLEKNLPPPTYLARRYNQQHGMIRYFQGIYRFPTELSNTDWDTYLKAQDYADGAIVYVLARNAADVEEARALAGQIQSPRVLVVIPRRPLLYEEHLRELLALTELKNDPAFKAQDERVESELDFYIEDALTRLRRALAPLLEPQKKAADWYYQGRRWERYPLDSSARVMRLLSGICERVFPFTPVFHNEMLNVRNPSAQQIRAAERVIDGLLNDPLPANLDITGYGPDWLILQTILTVPGFLKEKDGALTLVRPKDPRLAAIWDEIEHFVQRAKNEPLSFAELLDALQSPPYGLRRGILPVLIAAVIRPHLRVITIRHNGKAVLPITGATFTALCREPDTFSLEVGPEDPLQEAMWNVLESIFVGPEGYGFVREEEKRYQPLRYLSLGMIRWLQSLPRFARDTKTVSAEAQQFRALIRQSVRDPAPVLFHDLPSLLLKSPTWPEQTESARLRRELERLMGELETAYQHLLRRLDAFAVHLFAPNATPPCVDGRSALAYWVTELQKQSRTSFSEFRFRDPRAEGLAAVLRMDVPPGQFWDTVGRRLIGQAPRDWNDQSEELFYRALREAKAEVERELLGLTATPEEAAEIHLNLRGEKGATYRFRQVELSKQGERLLEHFKSIMAVSGRPLSPDERRQVAVEFLRYVLHDDAL